MGGLELAGCIVVCQAPGWSVPGQECVSPGDRLVADRIHDPELDHLPRQ